MALAGDCACALRLPQRQRVCCLCSIVKSAFGNWCWHAVHVPRGGGLSPVLGSTVSRTVLGLCCCLRSWDVCLQLVESNNPSVHFFVFNLLLSKVRAGACLCSGLPARGFSLCDLCATDVTAVHVGRCRCQLSPNNFILLSKLCASFVPASHTTLTTHHTPHATLHLTPSHPTPPPPP